MQRLVPGPEQCLKLVSFDGVDASAFNTAYALLYGTGMQLRELLGLRPMDVSVTERMRLEIQGLRARTLPVPRGAANRLTSLLDAAGPLSAEASIFGSPPISVGQNDLYAELKRRSLLLGFPQALVTGDLRIAFARHLTDRQTPIEIIATMMGYKDPNPLQRLLTLTAS
jgi:site-specific recombinase XerC